MYYYLLFFIVSLVYPRQISAYINFIGWHWENGSSNPSDNFTCIGDNIQLQSGVLRLVTEAVVIATDDDKGNCIYIIYKYFCGKLKRLVCDPINDDISYEIGRSEIYWCDDMS